MIKEPNQRFRLSPIQLIVIMGMLQLLVTLLTYGFTLSFAEAMWHYIGRNWFRHGLVPYKGGVDNKSPLVFAIYGLSDILFGVNYWFPRVLGTVVQCTGIYFVYKIANRMAGKQAGMLAILVYGLSLMWRITDGKLASVTQTYEITCIIIAFYLMLTAKNGRYFIGSGLMAGLGFGFRISACFGILALFISTWRKGFLPAIQFAMGVLIAWVALAVLAYAAGISFHDLFFYGFTDNFGNGSPTDHNLVWKMEHFSENFINSEMVLLYPGMIGYFLIVRRIDWLGLWLISEFIGINIVAMYDHAHLKDVLPELGLANSLAIAWAIEKYSLPLKPINLIVWIVFFPKLVEPVLSFKKLVTGEDNTGEQYCRAPYPELDNYIKKKLGWWIRSTTSEKDKVLVAGDGAEVQVYTERISPSIYFNATETAIARERFMQDLRAEKPALIAIPLSSAYEQDTSPATRAFLDQLIKEGYNFEKCMYGYNIYRVKGPS